MLLEAVGVAARHIGASGERSRRIARNGPSWSSRISTPRKSVGELLER